MSVSRETQDQLDRYRDMVLTEAVNQNLVAASTLTEFNMRHIDDSAQLIDLAPGDRHWLDIGTGAGLPGIVLAILGAKVRLVESRRLRSDFLMRVVATLGLEDRATIFAGRLEAMPTECFDIVTARAFAPLPRLLACAYRFSSDATRWILPKGRTAQFELEDILATWHGRFETVASRTNHDAAIIVATGVRPKAHSVSGTGWQR